MSSVGDKNSQREQVAVTAREHLQVHSSGALCPSEATSTLALAKYQRWMYEA